MAPFMSCGARLAIFAVFAAAFFGKNGASVVFTLFIRDPCCYFDGFTTQTYHYAR